MMEEEGSSDGMMEEEGSSDEMMEEGSSDEMMEEGSSDEMMDKSELALSFAGLENLGEGFAYEGWLIVEGQPLSTGVFTVDDEGMPSVSSFALDAEVLEKATTFVLTIEPVPDSDPAPSAIHVLAGDFDGDSAELTAIHPAAIGLDFAEAGGIFILGIPSSNSASDSYRSGIWFTQLDLPALPEGWVYEGWVAGPEGPITTGRFANGTQVDSDGTGPTAGPNPGPAFPGQDFLNPPLDLTQGYAVVISIEPEPDNSPAPFAFKPLVATITDAGDHVNQTLESNVSAFPTGSATRHVEAMAQDTAMMMGPDWFYAELTDVNSGDVFTIADFHGKVVLVETMAIWCPKCLDQQEEVKMLRQALSAEDDLLIVVLDIDPNEDAAALANYAERNGFDWIYAVASAEVAREIGLLYGDQFLNPPSTPMFVIDRQGEVHPLPFGHKSVEKLQDALSPFLGEDL
jgi:hypothetical protein